MYEPTNWSKGDKIKADKLNKIERGITDADASVYQMQGTISDGSSGVLASLSFELTSGDITQIPNYKSTVLRCAYYFIIGGEPYLVGQTDLPYIGTFNNGGETVYQFGGVAQFGSGLIYTAVYYTEGVWHAKAYKLS